VRASAWAGFPLVGQRALTLNLTLTLTLTLTQTQTLNLTLTLTGPANALVPAAPPKDKKPQFGGGHGGGYGDGYDDGYDSGGYVS